MTTPDIRPVPTVIAVLRAELSRHLHPDSVDACMRIYHHAGRHSRPQWRALADAMAARGVPPDAIAEVRSAYLLAARRYERLRVIRSAAIARDRAHDRLWRNEYDGDAARRELEETIAIASEFIEHAEAYLNGTWMPARRVPRGTARRAQ